jgi:two-component system, OmpR family, response regulator
MANIFWVEDQFHWIDKFKPLLESADFNTQSATIENRHAEPSKSGSSKSESVKTEDSNAGNKVNKRYSAQKNNVEVHKFVESASHAIKLAQLQPDIVILDANMNGNDNAGLTVSKLVKQKWPQVPVIYLSEHSGTGIEEKAFEQNAAQDFIAKHQQNIEQVLCWRIKALLRQSTLKKNTNTQVGDDIIQSGHLKIDLATWNVYWFDQRLMNPNNVKRPLAPMPRKILKILVESSPRPVTSLQMAEQLCSDKFTAANYRQHIKTLRHSFEQAALLQDKASFIEYCKQGKGITTFGDEGGYCWVK